MTTIIITRTQEIKIIRTIKIIKYKTKVSVQSDEGIFQFPRNQIKDVKLNWIE